MCVSKWWQGHFEIFTSLSFDANILVLCKMFIKVFINSTSIFVKIHVENNPYRGSHVFFLLNCPFSVSQIVSTYDLLGLIVSLTKAMWHHLTQQVQEKSR